MINYQEYYRVQEILWKKWLKSKKHTREFAYTWFIKCSECWSHITASEKIKKTKTTWETKTYIYYHCTKRKNWTENCTQKPIKLEYLEKQIDEYLSNVEIIPEFKDWALNILKEDFKNDVSCKESILKNFYNSLEKVERKLAKLVDSLTSELISDEEYKTSKKIIQIDINNRLV